MAQPTVSVCIPTHNTAKYLREALDSVLRQEFRDCEIVVCDDASTDGTEGICRSYTDPRLRYMRYSERGGQARNFNRCLAESRGEMLTLLHADDYQLPGFLSNRVNHLRANPDAGFVFGSVQNVDAGGRPLSTDRAFPEDRFLERDELLEALLHACLVSPPSLLVRRSCVDAAGPFRTDLTWGHDWEWTLRLAEQGGAMFVAQPLAAYRIHDESGTADQLRNAKNADQEHRILEEALVRLSGRNERFRVVRKSALRALSRRQMYFAELSLMNGRRAATRYNLRYAIQSDGSMALRPTFWALLVGSLAPLSIYRAYRKLRGARRAAGS